MEYNRTDLVSTLVYHWPGPTNNCSCGWAELGKSFPEHVANVYEMVLREGERARG